MLYPAELQALLQPRPVTVAQDFSLCLARETGEIGGKSTTRSSEHFSFQSSDRLTRPAFLASLASLAVQEPVGQEYFFTCRSRHQAKRIQGGGFFLR